jgi:hypothetical protein
MVLIETPDKLISFEARKKLGVPNQYGQIVYGVSDYGVKNNYAGIYQMRPRTSGRVAVRMNFYAPPETALRIANPRRGVFANAVSAWQALSTSQKEVYRVKSWGKHMSGYNVFLHEFLISH